MSEGWVKLYRKSLQWEWYKKPHMFHLFSHLVMSANHEDGRWQGVEVKRGQLITGRKSLSDATGISQQTIRTCLTRLQQTGEINQQTNQLFSIITINNYDEYQTDDKKSTSESTSDQPTINQPSTTNKNVKNEKNIKDIVGQEPRPRNNVPVSEIVKILNEKAGTNFKPTSDDTQKHIKARFAEKFTLEDFKTVIDFKVGEWATNAEMRQYIRPKTLFGPKFESYLQAAQMAPVENEWGIYGKWKDK